MCKLDREGPHCYKSKITTAKERKKKNTQPNSRKRKTQHELQEDIELKKKILDGHNKGIERNERQRKELQKLDVGK